MDIAMPVQMDRVSKAFGEVRALDEVSLTVPAGGIVGLVGPNGCGKTTLLSLVSGLRTPSRGRVSLFGGDPRSPRHRTLLGLTPQQSGLSESSRVHELVTFVGRHFTDQEPTDAVLREFHLEELAKRKVGGLSGGQQRLLAVALAFVGKPRLVLLDEPSTGLDVTARGWLWEVIRGHAARGVTIVLTSHYLEEVQALADRIVLMKAGRIVADGTTQSVIATNAYSKIVVTTTDNRVAQLPGVAHAAHIGDRYTLTVENVTEVTRALARSDIEYSNLDIVRADLGQAFETLTEDGQA